MAASSCVQKPLQETDRTSSSAVQRMEPLWRPRGCKRWQSSANRGPAEAAETSENRCDRCHPLPEKFHGKEGVDGSSPSEGLQKLPGNGHLVLPVMARFGLSRVRDGYIFGLAGICGHGRRLPTQHWACRQTRPRAPISESPCKESFNVACVGATLTPSFGREGVVRPAYAARLCHKHPPRHPPPLTRHRAWPSSVLLR
jgi:hypothetical protein